jgi:hypothetical protein
MKFELVSDTEKKSIESFMKTQYVLIPLSHILMFFSTTIDVNLSTMFVIMPCIVLVPLNFIHMIFRPREFWKLTLVSVLSVYLHLRIPYLMMAGERYFNQHVNKYQELVLNDSFKRNFEQVKESDEIIIPKEFGVLNRTVYIPPERLFVHVEKETRYAAFYIVIRGIDNHIMLLYSPDDKRPPKRFMSLVTVQFKQLKPKWYLVQTT